jgi:4'-phosphopantetheinyl transferase
MVHIYLTKFERPLAAELWDSYFSLLTPALKARNVRFVSWQDRHAHLFGKLLLLKGLKDFDIHYNVLPSVQFNAYERPFLPNVDIDFNISHSGKYVLCAIAKNIKVGVDVEENREISLEDFKKIMTPKQWGIINNHLLPHKLFYDFWAIKESVIKADGHGLNIPLDELEIEKNTVNYDGEIWHITGLDIDTQYASAIATNKPSDIQIHEIDFYNKNIIDL